MNGKDVKKHIAPKKHGQNARMHIVQNCTKCKISQNYKQKKMHKMSKYTKC